MRILYWFTVPFIFLFFLQAGHAQVMTSDNYQLESDSVNFGGGRSSSSNYIEESTLGEIGTGEIGSASYTLRAGYQQMQEVFLSLAGATNVVLSPSIPGVSGGVSNGSTTVTAVTDGGAGYQLTITFSDAPALVSDTDSIADYSTGVTADYDFTTTVTDSHFGFSPSGVDVIDRYKDSTSVCGSGSVTNLQCWDGPSTTAQVIAQGAGSNQPDGATTTIYFRVGVGSQVLQAPGAYIATTTVTLLSL